MSETPYYVTILYTNHRGERRERRITPHGLYYGTSAWHEKEQWLLDAYDLEKGEKRTFAMEQIHSWKQDG